MFEITYELIFFNACSYTISLFGVALYEETYYNVSTEEEAEYRKQFVQQDFANNLKRALRSFDES